MQSKAATEQTDNVLIISCRGGSTLWMEGDSVMNVMVR